jgi:hypothetical protein
MPFHRFEPSASAHGNARAATALLRPIILGLGLLVLAALGGCGEAPDAGAAAVILITGSTGGLGREVALDVASTGAHVVVHGRNEERGMEVVRAIEEEGIGSAEFIGADLASLDETRALADEIRSRFDRLDILVNNAGIWLEADEGRVVSDDGFELHFQVNYLSHFLLTHELLPLILKAERAGPDRERGLRRPESHRLRRRDAGAGGRHQQGLWPEQAGPDPPRLRPGGGARGEPGSW